jgi:hypothetical protein
MENRSLLLTTRFSERREYKFTGLMSISLTNKLLCLDKKRLIKSLLVGFIINSSKPNMP